MNSAVCDAAPVHSVQRCLEELEQHILALELTTATTKNRKVNNIKIWFFEKTNKVD